MTQERLSPQARTLHRIAYWTFRESGNLNILPPACYYIDYGRMPESETGRCTDYRGNGIVLLYTPDDNRGNGISTFSEQILNEHYIELRPEHEVMVKLNWVLDPRFEENPWLSMDMMRQVIREIGVEDEYDEQQRVWRSANTRSYTGRSPNGPR